MNGATSNVGIAGSRPAGQTARSGGGKLPAIAEECFAHLSSPQERQEARETLEMLLEHRSQSCTVKVVGSGVLLICPGSGMVKNWSFESSSASHEFAALIERVLAA